MNEEERQAILKRLKAAEAEIDRLSSKYIEDSKWGLINLIALMILIIGIGFPVIGLTYKELFVDPKEVPETCRALSSTNTSVWVKDSQYKEISGPAIIVVKDTDKAKDQANASDNK